MSRVMPQISSSHSLKATVQQICSPILPRFGETNHQLRTLFSDCLGAGGRPAPPARFSSKFKCGVL